MIEFINISKVYNGREALKDINLEIAEQEFTFLIGASGSGKTTLIKLLIREENPSQGNIYFYDTEITKLKETQVSKLRREIGVVFQDFKLLPHKNLYENIAFALEVSGKSQEDTQETVNYVLELVDLADRADAFPNEISGGEKQKIAIARAIANNPKVLIADEPTGNLDPKSSWEIVNLLQKINEWGTTIIMATHGSEFVEKMGKRVVKLDQGRIISDSTKETGPTIPITTPSVSQTKKLEKLRPKPIKKKKKKKKIEEKEFEISFSTKQSSAPSAPKKMKKKQKRKGSDVVDLHKLRLSPTLEEKLVLKGISSVQKLKQLTKDKLLKSKGVAFKEIKAIKKALEKNA
ncbi:cell division ATP-binding protein FtsE [Patescibacteria group bacterium]|nr:cell division ATP-binding protein FtsE [Patescibacteria group bacterium]